MEALFQKVAAENGTTAEQVYQEIQEAIHAAMQSENPEVREKWLEMSQNDTPPTPEEAVCGILAMVLAHMDDVR
jgi:hypothetical protein